MDTYCSAVPKYVYLIKQYYNSEVQKINHYRTQRLRGVQDDRQRRKVLSMKVMRDSEKLLNDISSTLDFYYFRSQVFKNAIIVNHDDDELLEMLDF